MENTQVEGLGQSITKRLNSAIMSLLRAYHIYWKMDGIIIYYIMGIRREDDLPVLLNFLNQSIHTHGTLDLFEKL